ncbi:aminotransferase class V-fold PLP-dependent enzyme [Mucilaginibacter sp. SMC90]|uniref:aminotransferase class V-fold PLP-dependent enzyme n=1 Tax=Mucilaginibacter sp. SMC90 TaxID=2929803 RepID=UPI001FB1D159|nr:aminotransferase class V-fold PLP-dependent enzyme [Mucilaginibacter sp. SMC90]UOE50663.1 aminotransferase class V-fold PLP-dependent enzyme [Mucilaginibacter sp. SMC90]
MKNILTEQEVQQLRAETRGTTKTIHFNNAGSSLPPDVVVDTVINYLHEEAQNGGYETEYTYRDELENTYSFIAQLINAHKDEIAVVENASTGWWLAFNGIDFKPGDEIITCEMEYVTNLIGLLHAQKTYGVVFKVIPNDDRGNFQPQALEDAITNRTKLIAATHIPSTAGYMMPVVEIGKIARRHNILYLLDACQSAGHVPLDVQEIGCDMLAVTGRKYLRAPRGTGFLYVRKAVQDKLKLFFMDGFTTQWVTETDFKPRSDARRFEVYEKSRALTLGLGKAVEYALDIGIERAWQRVQYLANLLREKLKEVTGITVHDFGDQLCGIVTFSVEKRDGTAVKNKLAEKHINVSVGKAASTLIYMNKNHLNNIVRASVHYYNTEQEIELLCVALREIV